MRTDRQRLEDILEAIRRIEKHAVKGKAEFGKDELLQSWIMRHLQVLGEAARGVAQPVKDAHPEIPWLNITGMRNALVHNYFEIDEVAVWDTVQKDLPNLKKQISGLLNSL